MNDHDPIQAQLYAELERKGLFGTVFWEAAIGIALTTVTGQVLAYNPALQHMLGYGEEELCYRTIGEISFPEDIAADEVLFRELVRGQRPFYQMKKRYVHKDGHIVWGRLTVSLVRDAAGAPQLAIGMVEDITEQERAEEERRQACAQLQQTQDQLLQAAKLAAIGELAASVAHELNNPLTNILGYADLLLKECAPDDPRHRDLEIIAAEARRTQVIVRGLLGSVRPSRKHRQPTDINALLQQALAVMRQCLRKGDIRVVDAYAPDLGPVSADPEQIVQVLCNLLANASQAMPAGGTLSLRTAPDDGGVAVAITDTGVGIPAENLARIFEPFFSTKPSGTGLGLAISRGIVQEHGGRIAVESEVGQGSTFTVWLPGGEKTWVGAGE